MESQTFVWTLFDDSQKWGIFFFSLISPSDFSSSSSRGHQSKYKPTPHKLAQVQQERSKATPRLAKRNTPSSASWIFLGASSQWEAYRRERCLSHLVAFLDKKSSSSTQSPSQVTEPLIQSLGEHLAKMQRKFSLSFCFQDKIRLGQIK